jgi:hypothetical protein
MDRRHKVELFEEIRRVCGRRDGPRIAQEIYTLTVMDKKGRKASEQLTA